MPSTHTLECNHKDFSKTAKVEEFTALTRPADTKNLTIRFYNSKINSDVTAAILKHIQSLAPATLTFAMSQFFDDVDFCKQLVDLFKTNESITALNITNCKLSNAAAEILTGIFHFNTTLQAVDLDGNRDIKLKTKTRLDVLTKPVTRDIFGVIKDDNITRLIADYFGVFKAPDATVSPTRIKFNSTAVHADNPTALRHYSLLL